MGILLGLTAALLYGGSDFGGGLASRRFGSLQVTLLGSAVATVLAWATLIMVGGPGPSLRAVAWGLASGLAGGAGTLVLYRGLARGQMSVVGPVSAVGAAVVPVVAGVALGERPSLLAVAGVLVSLPAIVLVAASGSVRGKLGAGLLDGLAAGLAFGILFIGLAQAGRNAGLWPVASEQTGALLVTLAVAVKTREPLRIPVRAAGLPVLAGAAAWPPRWPTSTPRTSACWPSPPCSSPCTRASPSCWPGCCCTSGSPRPSGPALACAPWPSPPSP